MKDINSFIDEISAKFGYPEMLTNDLKRIVPLMIDGKSDDKRQMLFDTLSETKIFVLPFWAKPEELAACKEEIFGSDNKGIKFIAADQGEYGKEYLTDGAYISEPVFDSDMNIIGRNRMIFIKELGTYNKLRDVYGSGINLSHLIHELGHAWVAQKDEFVQNEQGGFVQNVGAASITHSIDKDKKEVKGLETTGLFIEETLNTIQEEEIILKLTATKDMEELRKKGYCGSAYQGLQTRLMEGYVEKFGKEVFDIYRFSKDKQVLSEVEATLANTEAWQILGTEEHIQSKRASIMDAINGAGLSDSSKSSVLSMFNKYEDVFFSTNAGMTPIEKLDNVLTQLYNFKSVQLSFIILGNEANGEKYKQILTAIVSEANALRKEAKDIGVKKAEDLSMMEQLTGGIKDDKEVVGYYHQKNDNIKEQSENTRDTI